jgi:hypothetical protein
MPPKKNVKLTQQFTKAAAMEDDIMELSAKGALVRGLTDYVKRRT